MIKQSLLEAENEDLKKEIKKLNFDIKKLSRELRITKNLLDKVTLIVEAKEQFSNALSAANERQKAYTEVLLTYCPSIIILLDENGRFILSTKAFIEATEVPNFDFIKGKSYEEILTNYFSSEDIMSLKLLIEDKSSTNSNFDTLANLIKSNEGRFYSINIRHINNQTDKLKRSTVNGTLLLMTDITDFIKQKQKAEIASNAKSDFLATMSHEIRTPMNSIFGMTTALERMGLEPSHQKYVEDIRKASSSLLTMINDILDFSKIEAGKMDIININFNLEVLVDNLSSMFLRMGENKGLKIEFIVDESLPKQAFADENRIRQILTNLLSNAVKYTQKGNIFFHAYLDDKNNMRFDVKDTGIGIKNEDISKLFIPFEQLDIRKNRNIAGTGLGLAITYKLCRILGGEIFVKSDYGKGSMFSVTLPYVPASDTYIENTEKVIDFMSPKAKILVVDDMETNLTVAEVMLDIFDIVPDLAKSGKEAIKLAKLNKYDLIFMDHMMPEMDGIETTHNLRNLDQYSQTPIIALTANTIKGTENLFLSNGLNDILAKPIEYRLLNLCLRKWLVPELIEDELE